MTDKNFTFAGDVWEYLNDEGITFSSNAQLQLSISDWETLTLLQKTTIITKAEAKGFVQDP